MTVECWCCKIGQRKSRVKNWLKKPLFSNLPFFRLFTLAPRSTRIFYQLTRLFNHLTCILLLDVIFKYVHKFTVVYFCLFILLITIWNIQELSKLHFKKIERLFHLIFLSNIGLFSFNWHLFQDYVPVICTKQLLHPGTTFTWKSSISLDYIYQSNNRAIKTKCTTSVELLNIL
jgi:hypothetical protein